jgi:DNA-binding beta-propeller fold protein YncE
VHVCACNDCACAHFAQLPSIDAARTVVSGTGCTSFTLGELGRTHNVFRVTCVNAAGAPVIVTARNVRALLSRRGDGGDGEVGTATVTVAPTGELSVAYTVTGADVAELSITVIVRGVTVWTGVAARHIDTVTGRHTRTYPIAGGGKYGLVVTPDGRYMAVSYQNEHKLRVYRLEADGAATLLHTVGTIAGAGPKQFNNPYRMCLTPAGNLLVCDYCNDRVQELTGLSEAEPEHMRFIPVTHAWAIALHGDTLAVSTTGSADIQLLSYASGALIRSIGSKGSGLGQIGSYFDGIHFTPDGQLIVAAEHNNKWLSMFRVSDGCFVKHIGAGVVANGNKDMQFAPNGELLVADPLNHRVCVFSADGDTLLRSWGTRGSVDGQFECPTGLALADYKLLVLDCNSARVQVFE